MDPTGSLFGPPAEEDSSAGGTEFHGVPGRVVRLADLPLWSPGFLAVKSDAPTTSLRSNTNHHGGTRTRTVSFTLSAEEKTRDEDRRPRQGAPSRPEHRGVSDQQPFFSAHHSILLSPGRSCFPLSGARVRCSPFAHWAEETLHALFWSGAPI